MPRGNAAYEAAASKPEIVTAWLVGIPSLPEVNDPSTTIELYFTDHQTEILYDGKTYLPSPLSISAPKASKDMEKASGAVALCNLPNQFSGYAKNYRIKDGKITVTHAVLNGATWVGMTTFVGVMDAPTITESQISVNISAGRSVAALIPRELYHLSRFPHLPSSKDPRTVNIK